MSPYWAGKRVLVTGGAGFLGSYVVDELKGKGAQEIFVPRSKDYDLVGIHAVKRVYADSKPNIVIHLAAQVGGIGANQTNPGKFLYDNLIMGTQLLEVARQVGIEKFVTIGTVCAYPKFTATPFKEEDLWNGYPEETNAPYGLAKKVLLVQSQAYRQQYGFNSIYLLQANLYGPRDNFDLQTSHVIPALIRRFMEAKKRGDQYAVLWGTGKSTREFLYAKDAAKGILLAAEHYNDSDPVNLGSGHEISIHDLAALIAKMMDFDGEIKWDASRPDGQPKRLLDTTKAEKLFGFKAKTSLIEGLQKTIDWYLSRYPELQVAA